MQSISRRDLLRLLASGVAGYATLNLLGCRTPTPVATALSVVPPGAPAVPPDSGAGTPIQPVGTPHLVVVRGTDPAELTRRAVAALGGIERFVKPGQTVIVKPNICHAPRGVEYGTTTHPDVVGALVALAVAAGARTVQVMDAPFASSPKEAYDRSGIGDAVKSAGGEMVVMSSLEYAKTPIPLGRSLKHWSVYTPALKADVIIDVPVAKHHGSAGLSLGMKNLMGLLEPKGRGAFHGNLHQNIADLSTLFQSKLTVVDAMRTLMANGPTGGSLDDVKQQNTVFASADIVAADAYATTLFDRLPEDIRYIALAAEMGLGSADLQRMRIEELVL